MINNENTPSSLWEDMYLKFASEEEANRLLEDYEGNIDVIGVIYKPTGNIIQTDEGEFSEMAKLSGWHVNTRGPKNFDLEPFSVKPEPSTPVRVWA